jgi:hypothetical protein
MSPPDPGDVPAQEGSAAPGGDHGPESQRPEGRLALACGAGRTHDDLQKYDGDGLGGVVGLILGLLVQAAVLFTIPHEIEKMYQREGHQSPVTTLWGPVVPAADHRAVRPVPKAQSALNDFWTSKGVRPA